MAAPHTYMLAILSARNMKVCEVRRKTLCPFATPLCKAAATARINITYRACYMFQPLPQLCPMIYI